MMACILTWQDVKELLDCGVVLPLENINSFNKIAFIAYTFKILKYEIYQFMFQAPIFKPWNYSIGIIIWV